MKYFSFVFSAFFLVFVNYRNSAVTLNVSSTTCLMMSMKVCLVPKTLFILILFSEVLNGSPKEVCLTS